MKKRPLYTDLIEKLAIKHNKMAFITGPRQVGKTTLSEELLSNASGGKYFNWDDVEFKRKWIKDPKSLVPQDVGKKTLIVLDELHKAPRWKSYLKGLYDMRKDQCDIIVTGSARLDVFRKGGDSMMGRYFLFRLHPFSVGELCDSRVMPDDIEKRLKSNVDADRQTYDALIKYGGFPEPFLKKEDDLMVLWHRLKKERMVREDLIDLTRTHEIALIETAVALIPERVGSLFSFQSLAEDLGVAHPTASRWIEWLAQLYYLYKIQPFTKSISRSIKKQPKVYLWDWSEINDPAARFENLVAGHLLKAVHFWNDAGLGNFDLNYLRDKEKREVDLVVTRDRKPWMFVECKLSDKSPSANLKYFSSRMAPQITLQVIGSSDVQEWFDIDGHNKGQVISADRFLSILP